MALAKGQRAFDEAVAEDEALLQHFGLRLLSVQAGLRAAVEAEIHEGKVHPWNIVEINMKTWGWLRPLLVRLQEAEAPSGTGLLLHLDTEVVDDVAHSISCQAAGSDVAGDGAACGAL